MPYTIEIIDPKTKKVLQGNERIINRGTMLELLSTDKHLWMKITFNYAEIFSRTFNDSLGIKVLSGQEVEDTTPRIVNAILKLDTNATNNYWEPTEGNARESLIALLNLAFQGPKGQWKIS